jgi:hypothetical protein
MVALGVALAAGTIVAAQEKSGNESPPVQKKEASAQPAKGSGGGMYQFVSGDKTLTHGDEVTVTRKGGGTVKGTFVWMDPKANRLYIRPKAGATPVAVSADDIGGLTFAANVPDKGGVKTAINNGSRPGPRPEIHSMEIFNGTTRSVSYSGPTLSRAERDRLAEIDRAAADVAEKEMLVQSLGREIQNPRTDANVSVVQVAPQGPATLPYWAYPFYDYYPQGGYPTPWYYPVYGAYAFGPAGYGWGYGWGGYGWGNTGWAGMGYGWGNAPYGGVAPSSTVVVQAPANNAGKADLMKSLGEARTALSQAQKHYAAVRENAVYGPGGRIIAVRLPE